MLSSFVKWQLRALTLASVIGAIVLAVWFVRLPAMLGVGRYDVNAEFSTGAGLYKTAQVTYRGAAIGTVTGMHITPRGIVAMLSLKSSVRVPADVSAAIHSTSAVGEQYVDLTPSTGDGTKTGATTGAARLHAGDTIPVSRTSVPVEIGPTLDHVDALVRSVPPQQLDELLQETSTALNGRDSDIGAIIDHTSSLVATAQNNLGPTVSLIDSAPPLLTAITDSSGHINRFTDNLAAVTSTLAASDGQLRALLRQGPSFSSETTSLLNQLKTPTQSLLSTTTPIATMLTTYNGNIASALSDYPRLVAALQSVGIPLLSSHELQLTATDISEGSGCTAGYVPASKHLPPQSTQEGLPPLVYCTSPSSNSQTVKGANNLPCEVSAGRGATPAQCPPRK